MTSASLYPAPLCKWPMTLRLCIPVSTLLASCRRPCPTCVVQFMQGSRGSVTCYNGRRGAKRLEKKKRKKESEWECESAREIEEWSGSILGGGNPCITSVTPHVMGKLQHIWSTLLYVSRYVGSYSVSISFRANGPYWCC